MSTPAMQKPLPKPTPVTQPFWDGTRAHRIVMPVDHAGNLYWYPRVLDPGTLREPSGWREVAGTGTVYSFTIDRRGSAPAFAAEVPYVIAIVELDAGPRMTSNIIGCSVDEVRVGMRVVAVFEDVNDEITLVKFRPE